MYVVRHCCHQVSQRTACFHAQYFLRDFIAENCLYFGIFFNISICCGKFLPEVLYHLQRFFHRFFRNYNFCCCRSGDSIFRLPAEERCNPKTDAVLFQHGKQCCNAHNCICVPQVDANAGVPAQQSIQLKRQGFAACRRFFPICFPAVIAEVAARAGIAEGADGFPVQVDQIIPLQILRIQGNRIHAVFFICCQNHAQCTMPQAVIL